MSNRPNDFDDDDFRFDDDDDSFRFDDDNDINFNGGLGDDFDADLPTLDDDTDTEGRGPSRTFIIIAAVMIILFVVAIGALVLISRPSGPTPIELTSTAIAIANATTIAQGLETATQGVVFGITQTQDALNATLTAQAPTETPTPSPSPTATQTPTVDPTQVAATAIALNTQIALTQAALPPALPTLSAAEAGLERIQQAATAVAAVLLTQVPGAVVGVPAQPDVAATSTALVEIIQTQVSAQVGEPVGPVAQVFTPVAQILSTAIVLPGGNAPVVQQTATAVADVLQTEIAQPTGNVPAPQLEQVATLVAQVLQDQAVQPITGGVSLESLLLTSTSVAAGLQAEVLGPDDSVIGVVAQAVTPVGDIFLTQIAGQVNPTDVAATATAVSDLFATALAEAGQGGGNVSLPAVAQTATELARLLQQPTIADAGGGVIASPTIEGGTSFGPPRPTALPDTGLFDDIAAGSPAGMGAIVLAVAGLLGVIIISRRLRTLNK
jgi:hypothetical protein